MQRVAAMLCFTAEGHIFGTYITVIIKVTYDWLRFECTRNGWGSGTWSYGKLGKNISINKTAVCDLQRISQHLHDWSHKACSFVGKGGNVKARSMQCHALIRKSDRAQTASSCTVYCTGHKHWNLCSMHFSCSAKSSSGRIFGLITKVMFFTARLLLAWWTATRWSLMSATLR